MSDEIAELQRVFGDDYAIERRLGRGGMGAVYLARDPRLQRQVAIKVLAADLSGNADLRERFFRETRVAASFSHPNIVPVHAVEERDGLLAFVMGYVDGETLGARLTRGPLTIPDAVRIVQEVAWALSYAHNQGVVHRDIKPDNILIERSSGRALVTDFGIARMTSAAPGAGLTRVGEVVGTPEYMSPEQAAGDQVDGRSDIYSLGVTAFHALTGTLPFVAETPTALLAMHLTQPAPPVVGRRVDAPDDLAEAIDRSLQKTPEARWASAEALASALDGMRRSAPEVPPPVRFFLQRFNGNIAAAVLMAGLVWALFPPRGTAITVDHLAKLTVVAACALGIALAGLRRVRGLQLQGFRYRDVVAAVGVIIDEERVARDAVRASAGEMKRRRRNTRIALFSMAWPIAMIWWIRTTMRHPLPGRPAVQGVSLPGVLTALASAVAFGLGIALLMSDPLKPNPWVRIQAWLWRGPAGRMLFRVYGRGIAGARDNTVASATAASGVATTGAGARTLIAALPKQAQRDVRGAMVRFDALDEELRALDRREQDLQAALSEVGDGSGSEQQRTLSELQFHLAAVDGLRDGVRARIERGRLELVRLRAGIGSADAVLRALQDA